MLKQKYISQEKLIASYDYTDIASGLGYSIFYGANVSDGTASGSYIITPNTFYSDKITTFDDMGVAVEKMFDGNFDTSSFNLPKDVKGDAIIQIPLGIGRKTGQTGDIAYINASGSIVHYDGTTEISLGSFKSTEFSVNDAVKAYDYSVTSTKVNLTEQHFKVGDILRLKLEIWKRGGVAGGRYFGFGHDPKNQPDPETLAAGGTIYDDTATTYGPTTMEVHVPFKIDL